MQVAHIVYLCRTVDEGHQRERGDRNRVTLAHAHALGDAAQIERVETVPDAPAVVTPQNRMQVSKRGRAATDHTPADD